MKPLTTTMIPFLLLVIPIVGAFAACPPVSLNTSTNVWKNLSLYHNVYYSEQVLAAGPKIQDPVLQKKALQIADVGVFYWVNNVSNIQAVESAVGNSKVPCDRIVGVVLQGIEGRNCTSPRFKVTAVETYKREFVDPLSKIIGQNPGTAFAVIVEPGPLGNIVVNLDSNLPSCAELRSTYRGNAAYAIRTLNLPNVVLYLDAGHGGTIGLDKHLKLGAEELAALYKLAGSPSQVRGIAVNTANYNSWDLSPGEFSNPWKKPENFAINEQRFITMLGKELAKVGVPHHAIMDTSRNGAQGWRYEWEDWCNIYGAGFGRRPTAEGLGLELADAFVWAKAGGVSDGTSDESSPSYDPFCGKVDAFKPSPEAGEWNQEYFEMLLENARPEIEVDHGN
ncbi:glycoside hydrolase family 6 protein [Podospora australis]|uniref:Glucanase n=1 Tax=Podospora australis TaxID=1536484 RepID=A0AAN6WI62_9PEZI|nr:glycoside hydrolase family 6 protein [Podospora australis]